MGYVHPHQFVRSIIELVSSRRVTHFEYAPSSLTVGLRMCVTSMPKAGGSEFDASL